MLLTVRFNGLFEIVASNERESTIILSDDSIKIDHVKNITLLRSAILSNVEVGARMLRELNYSVGYGKAIAGPIFKYTYCSNTGLSFSSNINYDELLSDYFIKITNFDVIIDGVKFERIGFDIRNFGLYESLQNIKEQIITTNGTFVFKKGDNYINSLSDIASDHIRQAIKVGVSLNDAPSVALKSLKRNDYAFLFMDKISAYNEQNNRMALLDYLNAVKYPSMDDCVAAVNYASNIVNILCSVSGADNSVVNDITFCDPESLVQVNGLTLPLASDIGVSPTRSKFIYVDDIYETNQISEEHMKTYKEAVAISRAKIISTIREIDSIKNNLLLLQNDLNSFASTYVKALDAWEMSNASAAVIRRQIEAILSAPICNFQSNCAFACVGDYLKIDDNASVNLQLDNDYYNKIFVPGDIVRACFKDYITMYGVNMYPKCRDVKSVTFPTTYLNNLGISYTMASPLLAPKQTYKPFIGKEQVVVNETWGFARAKFSSLEVLLVLLQSKLNILVGSIASSIKNSAALEAEIATAREQYFKHFKEVQILQARYLNLVTIVQNNSNYQMIGDTNYIYSDDAIEVPFILLKNVHSKLTDFKLDRRYVYTTSPSNFELDGKVVTVNNEVDPILVEVSSFENISNAESQETNQRIIYDNFEVILKDVDIETQSELQLYQATILDLSEIDLSDIILSCDEGSVTFSRALVNNTIVWTPVSYEFTKEYSSQIDIILKRFVSYDDVTLSFIRFMYGRTLESYSVKRPFINHILMRNRISLSDSLADASGVATLLIGV